MIRREYSVLKEVLKENECGWSEPKAPSSTANIQGEFNDPIIFYYKKLCCASSVCLPPPPPLRHQAPNLPVPHGAARPAVGGRAVYHGRRLAAPVIPRHGRATVTVPCASWLAGRSRFAWETRKLRKMVGSSIFRKYWSIFLKNVVVIILKNIGFNFLFKMLGKKCWKKC
jgi:hypothetical protein